MARVILLTGFEAFGGERVNPSWQVAEKLDGRKFGNATVRAIRLPVNCQRAASEVVESITRLRPAAVLGLGLAGGRFGLSLERVALNLADEHPVREVDGGLDSIPVVPGGPVAYLTRLPLKTITDELRAHHVPVATSLSAGVYVCNAMLYATLHALRRRPSVPAGFIHLPYEASQAVRRAAASMSLDLMAIGVELALGVIAVSSNRADR
jgi:pyroglutamyl-peptidase